MPIGHESTTWSRGRGSTAPRPSSTSCRTKERRNRFRPRPVTSLFVRPSYNQYYFGDYYAESDARAGILPWYSFHQSHRGYDPVFAHYSVVQARRDPRWLDRLRDDYQFRREHPEARPPHTYLEQQKIVNRTPQLEPLKAQQERQQLEQQKAQRQREQREQLEPLKAQQQRQQLEQLKGQQREQMEQLKAQRQQMEELKAQRQQHLEQLKAQQQQHLEQLKAQQRPRGDGGERPQKKERD